MVWAKSNYKNFIWLKKYGTSKYALKPLYYFKFYVYVAFL